MKHAKCKVCGTEDQTQFYPSRKYICKACYIKQVKEHREAEKEASDEAEGTSSLAELKESVKILLSQMDQVTQVLTSYEQKINALYLARQADKAEIDELWAMLEKESSSKPESYAPPMPVYNFPVIPETPAPNLPPLPDLPKVSVSAVDRDYDKLENLEWLYNNAEILSKQQLSDIRLKWQSVKTTPLVGKDQLVKIMKEWAERRYNRIEEEMRQSALLDA